MFPRSKPKAQERERDEADEERMASRLHLEMGMRFVFEGQERTLMNLGQNMIPWRKDHPRRT